MKINYKKLVPLEIPDEVVSHLADIFYDLACAFNLHLVRTMLHEKDKAKLKGKQMLTTLEEKS
jgi:hypothetical protein